MILYYFQSCRFCQRVLTIIDQLGIKSKIELRDILEHPAFGDELEKLNGGRQVPCLIVDGKPMLESMDIISFLKKKFSSETK
jgi:glutaredoxin 3